MSKPYNAILKDLALIFAAASAWATADAFFGGRWTGALDMCDARISCRKQRVPKGFRRSSS